LTSEKRSVYDYLEDIKTGGVNKRWQGAFELSKVLANPKHVPDDERFVNEMVSAFRQAEHDDNRIRQYLALAMGRSGDKRFLECLLKALETRDEGILASVIYALGMLKEPQSASALHPFLEHNNARVRSITVVALGNIADPLSVEFIKKALYDPEVNVQWGAAVSLSRMGDAGGKEIIAKLLDRNYLAQFGEVDIYEADQLLLTALDSAQRIDDGSLTPQIRRLSNSDQNMLVRNKALEILKP
jgi:HEAT repeat protein